MQVIDSPTQAQFISDSIARLETWLQLAGLAARADELAEHDDLKSSLESAVRDVSFFRTKHWADLRELGLYRVTLYALTRTLAARRVIETGVLHGLGSAFILQGLADDGGSGRLASIDEPSTFDDGPSNRDGFNDTLPPGLGPGWIVPDPLRRCWDLKLGRSTDLLPQVIDELGGIDLFIHDSEHAEATMRFEFETAWPAVRDGGVLLADNIDVNTSFFDFCCRVNRVPVVMPLDPGHHKPGGSGIRFGVIRK